MLFVLALSIIVSALALPVSVSASAFVSTINAFEYKGYSIPSYDGDISEVINSNKPKFTDSELNQNIYESYGALDSKGRVTTCSANIDKSLMPTEPRGSISSVYPTGWVQAKYDFISGKYLYNRSHLIGFQLTGENANKKNLMTGTRTFNATGMLEYENEVASYVRSNDKNNVLYRVTPVFGGDNLLAWGVIMEGESVDDKGKSVCFCVFVYNVEEGVSIDYSTGESTETGNATDISGAYLYLEKLKYVYCGKARKPAVSVTLNGKKLTQGRDFTVTYSKNIKVGKAVAKVKGKGAYSGTLTKNFKIIPKTTSISKLTKKKKAVFVKWRKQSVQTSGYQIRFSTSSKFKNTSTITIKSNKTTSRTIKRLKSNRRYYVKVRTYKTVNSKRYYSNWSKSKSVVTK